MKTLTVVELEFMRKLWALGEATPEEIKISFEDEGRILTGGTVRKMLGILEKKGYVLRNKKGRTYLYYPAVSEEKAKSGLLKDLMNRAFDGSASLVIAALFKNKTIHDDDFIEIEKLIERYKKENKK